MDLNSALKEFESVEANLAKLYGLWKQMKELLPTGSEIGVKDSGKYLAYQRAFQRIAMSLPKIDGYELNICLLDPDDITRGFIDCSELGEISETIRFSREVSYQEEVLDEYRFRMEAKRRELARHAIGSLSDEIESLFSQLAAVAGRLQLTDHMPDSEWQKLNALYKSIAALLGSTVNRGPRWNDMARHIGFGLRQDFEDITKNDWPTIKQWLEKSLYDDADPLPISATDLGDLVRTKPKGPVSTELNWSILSPIDFERLIFNLIDNTPGYVNPQWLTHTTAADRGRDLSVNRIVQDPLTGTRNKRIILACKHTDSVNLPTITMTFPPKTSAA